MHAEKPSYVFPVNASATNTILFIKWLFTQARDDRFAAHLYLCLGPSSQPTPYIVSSQLPQLFAMDTKYQRQKEQNNAVSSLNLAIEALNLAKEIANATPAKAVFGSVGVLLTMIRVRFLFRHEVFRTHT